ncbi:hypothetical protein CAPTEDRAFT_211787 [Capitella teleta]|uniref:Uncharacterized protein n=1 Tax=Capitella teleta TaxID=283909 RepID=R7T9T7_CAPTE|nr:hypothetical protein CAPTEDRAFT_211787 [Capitella teleta]|eukprot:ELT87764.1 hypothetical protein CAPTEDRAFT_211787 [Capitella teleta]
MAKKEFTTMLLGCLIVLIFASSLSHATPTGSIASDNLDSPLLCPSCGVMKLGPIPLYSDPNCDNLTNSEGVNLAVCPPPPPNHVSKCFAIQGSSDRLLLSTKMTVRDCVVISESDPRLHGGCNTSTEVDYEVKLYVAFFWHQRNVSTEAVEWDNWKGEVCKKILSLNCQQRKKDEVTA